MVSTNTNTNTSNTLRVTGLASGMNTDEIVSNLVKVKSARLFKMQQSKTLATWKQDAYRDVNKKIDEFRKSMESLRLQSTFNKQTVTSGDSRVEVSSGGTSTQTDFVISEVQLATSAKPAMVSFNSGGAALNEDMTLSFTNADTSVENIDLTANMSLDDVILAINNHTSNTKIKATNVSGSLVLTATDNTTAINLSTSDIDNTNSLKIANSIATSKNAEPGKVVINDTTIALSSNTFTFQGVTFNLKGNVAPNSNISVQVASDTQGIFDSIKSFVDKYNELIADLNGKLTEKKYRDYPPLLDDQKKDMKDADIKLWEDKAKSGLFQNDSTLSTFLTQMRNSLSNSVDSGSAGFTSLKDIGINLSTNYKDNGKLVIDEDKLKGFLKTNLEDVKKLFTNKGTGINSTSTTVTDTDMHKNSGFAWRIYDRLNVTISQISDLSGSLYSTGDTKSYLYKQIQSLDTNIDKEQDKISTYENRLYKQYGAMEKAIQKMNSQSSWLSQQFS
ncbi:flagellar filament capping protein FliD [Neobacillus sp. LXY-1]|uniref:flagellar filament capping protein FliD n=1 Tax=Neobacillus sp. LXY-1 TaxID=3379133 RepID=UPI003EDFFBCC